MQPEHERVYTGAFETEPEVAEQPPGGQAKRELPKMDPIDPRKLKLRELAFAEALLGRKLAGELQTGDLAIETMQAIVTVVVRRHIPDYTFEEAGELELEELMDRFADEDDAAPDLPPGVADPTRATRSGGGTSGV